MRTDDPSRRRELAKIHVAKQQLGLDDTVYRMILRRVSFTISHEAKESAALLTRSERRAVLEELKSRGWRERAARGARSERDLSSDPAHVRKLRACWLDLKLAGAIQDASEAALRRFVESRTGVGDVRWLTVEQASTLIESLKQWKRRVEERGGTAGGGAVDD